MAREMIVCVLPDKTIGKKGESGLLWHIPDELKLFKELTVGKNVVFGKNTYLSLPKTPLPNRINIVLTDEYLDLPNYVLQVDSIEKLNTMFDDYIVCGGGSIYSQMAKHVTVLYKSVITDKSIINNADGDLKFDAFEDNDSRFTSGALIAQNEKFFTIKHIIGADDIE